MSSLCKCFDKITGVSANGVIFLRIRISSFCFSQRSETANSMMFTSTTNLVWQLFCFECIMPCWSEISLQTGTDWWSWGLDSRFWGIKGLFYCFFSRLSSTNELEPLSRGAVLKWVWLVHDVNQALTALCLTQIFFSYRTLFASAAWTRPFNCMVEFPRIQTACKQISN